ncbi:MAG: hypothetical protein ACJ8FA_08160 [Xanthobacteraceae bacterium]
MAPVLPDKSWKDQIINAVFGRGIVGQTVKDWVDNTQKFFKGEKVETRFSGGAVQKKPPEPPTDWSRLNMDHDAPRGKPATKTPVAGVDDDISSVFGAGVMASVAMNRDHVTPDVARDRVEGALHTEARATAPSQPATSAPVSADDSWSFSMFAKQGTQPQQPTTDDDQDASQGQVAIASDSEDAPAHDAAQQPETDDDEEEQVAIASDDEDASPDDDAAQQPATEDDAEASQEEVAIASDDDDVRSDDDASQQPATDDDEDASAEQVAVASDAEAATADDAAVMETANAQAVPDPDDGFSFSAFPKPVTLADVVKEVMPAEQVSHEGIPGSGTLESETAPPDAGSEDVGNAAPSKELVHHGDLTP